MQENRPRCPGSTQGPQPPRRGQESSLQPYLTFTKSLQRARCCPVASKRIICIDRPHKNLWRGCSPPPDFVIAGTRLRGVHKPQFTRPLRSRAEVQTQEHHTPPLGRSSPGPASPIRPRKRAVGWPRASDDGYDYACLSGAVRLSTLRELPQSLDTTLHVSKPGVLMSRLRRREFF